MSVHPTDDHLLGIDGVRYAVGTDPEFPALGAVLAEHDQDGVRLVATDRYRLAVAENAGAAATGAGQALVRVEVVDELRDRTGEVAEDLAALGPEATRGWPEAFDSSPRCP